MATYMTARILKRRQDWIDSQGGKCAVCGSTENLEVDHKDPAQKEYDPCVLWSLALDNPKRIGELAKCWVLCRICHKAKTIGEKRTAQHGGIRMYRVGCRCKECRAANTRSQREYQARRRARNDSLSRIQ